MPWANAYAGAEVRALIIYVLTSGTTSVTLDGSILLSTTLSTLIFPSPRAFPPTDAPQLCLRSSLNTTRYVLVSTPTSLNTPVDAEPSNNDAPATLPHLESI
ncbi:hypothetical protein D9756_009843 [Leucocoprinus leucothites]|uniref:Uncharacterized protein n=1 Tax=Leucocoprinus leucothites TaxID=201217 RepID=A0A8H5FTT3_9AGAR|nr:hypothetical protein D9756_009843 [Leucoagaricus leucothites]